MGYGLGVDLGMTFTSAAVSDHGRSRIVTVGDDAVAATPVTVSQPAGDVLLRGGDLLTRAGVGGAGPAPASRLAEPVPLALGGRPTQGVPVLAGALRSVLEKVTAASGGEAPEKVALTCPAVWGPVRRQQFGEVSRQLGLETSAVVVSEPEAAVTFFVQAGRLEEGDLVAVYDLGAATVDMTVVRVSGSGTEILGQPEAVEGVGGVDFDDVVLAHADRVLGGVLSALDLSDSAAVGALEAARVECIRAKEALSWTESATVTVELPTGPVRVALSRAEFESMIRSGLESSLTGLRRAMLSAGVDIPDLAAVVLVGGSSRIPLVEQMLTKGLGRPVLTHEHPQHCAALGAAAIADEFGVRSRKSASARPGPTSGTMPLTRREAAAMPQTRREAAAMPQTRREAAATPQTRREAAAMPMTRREAAAMPQARSGSRLRERPKLLLLILAAVVLLGWVTHLVLSDAPDGKQNATGEIPVVLESNAPATAVTQTSKAVHIRKVRLSQRAERLRSRPPTARPPAG